LPAGHGKPVLAVAQRFEELFLEQFAWGDRRETVHHVVTSPAALRLGPKHQVHSLHRYRRRAAKQRCDRSSSAVPFAAAYGTVADQVVELGAAAM
jgi:hypothetical protein